MFLLILISRSWVTGRRLLEDIINRANCDRERLELRCQGEGREAIVRALSVGYRQLLSSTLSGLLRNCTWKPVITQRPVLTAPAPSAHRDSSWFGLAGSAH